MNLSAEKDGTLDASLPSRPPGRPVIDPEEAECGEVGSVGIEGYADDAFCHPGGKERQAALRA